MVIKFFRVSCMGTKEMTESFETTGTQRNRVSQYVFSALPAVSVVSVVSGAPPFSPLTKKSEPPEWEAPISFGPKTYRLINYYRVVGSPTQVKW